MSSTFHFSENVRHRFFSRKNGVSQGDFDSLNCSVKVGDDPFLVRQNLRRVAQNLSCTVEKIFLLHQTHSSIVIPVLDSTPFEKTPYGDALVTNQPNVFLGIKTADCAPVLFSDSQNNVIGAAHAGWRGAVGGVLENTITEMQKQGAELESISALIGPCIAPASYEVQEDMRQSFLEADIKATPFFDEKAEGVYQFNLPGYIIERLKRLGIGAVQWVEKDTYSMEKEYFSHRYSMQMGKNCGRQISVIGLLDESLF